MTANMHLVLAVLVGLAAYAVALIAPAAKGGAIACAVLALAFVLWRWWEGRR